MATKVKVKKGDTLNDLAISAGFSNYKEADASGFRSGNPDLIYEGEEISFGGTPKGAAPVNQDLGAMADNTDSKGFDFKGTGIGDFSVSDAENDALDQLINNSRTGATGDVDESEIRRKNLELFQGQIDSVNQIYDSLVAGEEIQGAGRLGSGRAIAGRQGLVGSQRGETQRQNIVARNSDIMQSIQAERAYKINQILGEAQKQSLAEIQAEQAAKRQSASDYLSYLGVQDERREKNMKAALGSLISQGFSLEDLAPDDLAEFAKNLKVSGDTLRSTYESLKTTEDPEYFNLSEGQSRYVIDPKTGEAKLVASKGKTYAPKGGSSGSGSGSGSGSTGGDDYIDVLSYDEFKATPEAQALIEEAQNQARQSFVPEKREEILKAAYEKQIAEIEGTTGKKANDGSANIDNSPSLSNLTTAKKSALEQAQLSGGSGNAQTYYLNTPSGFQQFYAREVASGKGKTNASLEDIDAAYSAWYAKENGDSEGGSSGGDEDIFNF